MKLLEVQNLSVAIRRKKTLLPAVDHISFDINCGDIAGLAGESGCGKTLTALSIMRLLPAGVEISNGLLQFNNGESLNLRLLSEKELCQIRGRDISIVFQDPQEALNPLMRVGAQIGEALELHGMKEKKERQDAARVLLEKLHFASPEKILRAFAHQLSGGMRQRVVIASAAICRPRLLIADEPCTALDAAVQEQILSLLLEINRDFGTAILFISHDLSLIRRFCKRLIIMYAGKIVEAGPAESVFSAPAHPYTRALINAVPSRLRRGKALANIPGKVPSIEDTLPGCPFAPRCPAAMPRCLSAFPPQTQHSTGHIFHCYRGAGND
jgi:oligopeptide/dipeptide ABC transporter ATP-binding protein